MDITDTDFLQANRQGAARQAAFPAAVAVRYDQRIERVVITLASKLEIAFAPGDVQALAHAAPASLAEAQISPSGLGIHFPLLDADLYLPALLEGFLGSQRWVASNNGKKGGQARSSAKSKAARENGKLGGRPRKVTPAEEPAS